MHVAKKKRANVITCTNDDNGERPRSVKREKEHEEDKNRVTHTSVTSSPFLELKLEDAARCHQMGFVSSDPGACAWRRPNLKTSMKRGPTPNPTPIEKLVENTTRCTRV